MSAHNSHERHTPMADLNETIIELLGKKIDHHGHFSQMIAGAGPEPIRKLMDGFEVIACDSDDGTATIARFAAYGCAVALLAYYKELEEVIDSYDIP